MPTEAAVAAAVDQVMMGPRSLYPKQALTLSVSPTAVQATASRAGKKRAKPGASERVSVLVVCCFDPVDHKYNACLCVAQVFFP